MVLSNGSTVEPVSRTEHSDASAQGDTPLSVFEIRRSEFTACKLWRIYVTSTCLGRLTILTGIKAIIGQTTCEWPLDPSNSAGTETNGKALHLIIAA
jgi:hypothetical protein